MITSHNNHGLIVCSHFPFAIWNQYEKGSFHLHGHCHGNFKDSLPHCKISKRLDIGVDVAKKINGEAFFSLDQVAKIMENKEIRVLDHHENNTTP